MSDGGLTIDLSGLRQVTVDPERKLVHAGGGCLLGNLDAATAPHRLIVPAGIMSETGVAGLALGGGIGWFSRKHGLTCDNFVSLELVLASGEVIEVNADSHPELFWALCGGGGNFGIVTRFTFRAHDFGPMMRIGVSVYEPEQAAAAPARPSPTWPRGPAAASTSTCSTSTSRTAWSRPWADRRSTPGWRASRPVTTRRTCSG
jgi:FAD/FMN-containing dehydrogenase